MSLYLEIPDFKQGFPYRCLVNDGMSITYPHWHKEIEIIYVNHGKVNIGVGETALIAREGEIIIFASGEPHYFLASPNSEHYVYQFDLKLFDESILREEEESLLNLFESREGYSRFWSRGLTERVSDLLKNLYKIEKEQPCGINYIIMGNLYQLIGEFYQHLPKKIHESITTPRAVQRKDTLDRLNKVFEYIENGYREAITVGDVAEYVGFSPHYFTHFFKKNTGQTFIQFLTEYRVNQAKFILSNEKVPMAEVAELSGFSSIKTFHHVFKKEVGLSPLQYQKKMMAIVQDITLK